MTKQDNAEPAFPQSMGGGEFGIRPMPGMTLRDWFAGQTLSGGYAEWGQFSAKEIATLSYTMADAMLAARSAK